MAKKKTAETAKIEATPVLRALGGEDPTPETPVVTKSYSVRDDWKDRNKVNYVAFKSVDGEVQDLTVNGEPAGGGGGGAPIYNVTWNITTGPATVTPFCVGDDGTLNCAMYDPETGVYQTYNDHVSQRIQDGEHTIKYVCFNSEGFIIIDFSGGSVTSTTGDVTYDGYGFEITGDCSISITIS